MEAAEDMQEEKLASLRRTHEMGVIYTRKRNYELDLTERAYAMAAQEN